MFRDAERSEDRFGGMENLFATKPRIGLRLSDQEKEG
jgi:hypothetical protein